MDTVTREIIAQLQVKNATNAIDKVIFEHYAEQELKNTVTDKADPTKEDQDTLPDHPPETAAHHLEEADVQTAQLHTTYTSSVDIDTAPHHTTSILLQL